LASIGTTQVVFPADVLPTGVAGSLYLEVGGQKAGSVTDTARVEVQLTDGSEFKVVNLTIPLTVAFPLVPDRCKLPQCNYWDEKANKWATDGCQTIQNPATNAYICSCTHATDFSMLLIDSTLGDCVEISPSVEPSFTFASVYIVVGLVALFYCSKVLALCRDKCYFELIGQHFGVFAVCTLRTFLALYQAGVAGPIPTITIATISAVPRLLEFFIFSLIVARWAAILHFGMAQRDPFKRMLKFLVAINVFAAVIVLYVFIAFAISPSYDAAIVGEALAAFNGVVLSVGFLVYSCWLNEQFKRIDANSAGSHVRRKGPRRMVLAGFVLSLSFIAQGVFACLALTSIPRDVSTADLNSVVFFLDLYNGLYRLFNVITLVCVLILYYEGVGRLTDPKSTSRKTSNTAQMSV
jgi:hypothetical protein